MKLHLIALAGLLAASGAAQAKIDNGLNSPGNGELFLSVWDNNGTAEAADDRSYTRDLGITLNDFASALASPVAVAPQPTFSFAADALMTSFLGQTSDLGNLRWNVAGFDAFSADRAALTVATGFAGSTQTYAQFRGWSGGAATHLAAVNPLGDNTSNAINASGTATSADGNAYSGGVIWGNNIGGKADFANDGGIGDSLGIWMFYETVASGSTTTKVKQLDLANFATLSADGGLLITPVPEPETYALMLAGLGLVGFMARRRKAA